MTTLKTGNGSNTTTYTYDNLSRVTKITDPMGLTETYTYDLNNNMLTKKTKNGDTLTYTYDAMNRVTKESSGTVIKGQYTYNAYNKVATETNGNSEITYGYNSTSGLIANSYTKVGTDTVLTMYFYDSKYNCTNISFGKVDSKGNFSDIHRQQFTYDTENRLKTVAENYNEGSYVTVATYTYDANGNVSKTALGNGVSTTYTYDKANNLTTLTNTNSAGTISKYTYTYLPDGNVSKKTESTGKVTTYTYDNLNRLKTEAITGTTSNKSYAYTYDKSGNRSSLAVTGAETYTTTYSYDKNNRLLEDQTYRPNEGITDINTYVYDKNGNQLRKYESQSKDTNGTTAISVGSLTDTDFNVEIYGYNAFNQLISYKDSDGTTASYTYLANGLRDSKTVDGTTTYFLWNGTNILADFDSSSNFTNVYSRGLQLIKNDSNTYYTFNGHGDVTSLTNSSGTVTKTYDYDAFGVEIGKNDTDTNPWRYCGEYYDTETDSIYLRARYYSPTIGRFTTEDPARDGLNWYSYCMSNPLAYVDLMGLAAEDGTLRNWVNNRSEQSNIKSNINWNAKTKTATVTITNTDTNETQEAQFTAGKDGAYIKDGRMYVSSEKLWQTFGRTIDPKAEVHPIRDAVVAGVVIGSCIYIGGKVIAAILPVAEKYQIPQKVYDILKKIKDNNGSPPKGYKGGKTYNNTPKNGGAKLPDGVNYKEYDVNPKIDGVPRDAERIVIGDDGSAWYTNDHYQTFKKIE